MEDHFAGFLRRHTFRAVSQKHRTLIIGIENPEQSLIEACHGIVTRRETAVGDGEGKWNVRNCLTSVALAHGD